MHVCVCVRAYMVFFFCGNWSVLSKDMKGVCVHAQTHTWTWMGGYTRGQKDIWVGINFCLLKVSEQAVEAHIVVRHRGSHIF
jgi:hypothetical protein